MERTGDDFSRIREMGTNDETLPAPVRDFLKEFYRALTLGRLYDISASYERGFRDISRQFYSTDPLPEEEEVAPFVNNDRTFLVLYKLLYYRHLLMRLPNENRPARMSEFAEAWDAYRELFDMVLIAADEESTNAPDANNVDETKLLPRRLQLPPTWVYDMLDEFLYHFQSFHEQCNRRSSEEPAEVNSDVGSEVDIVAAESSAVGGLVMMDMDDDDLSEVWRTEEVLRYLYRVVATTRVRERLDESKTSVGDAKQQVTRRAVTSLSSAFIPTTFAELAGYFSLTTLLRLHVKLGDYGSALECGSFLDLDAEAFFARVPKAHITMYYYYGFALLMARRYSDAAALYSRILLFFHRTGHLLGSEGGSGVGALSKFMRRQCEKMMALLAVPLALAGYGSNTGVLDRRTLAMLPGIEDIVVKRVAERHGEAMGKIANAASVPIPFQVLRVASRVSLSSATSIEQKEKLIGDALTDVSSELRGPLAAATQVLMYIFDTAAPGYVAPVVDVQNVGDSSALSKRQQAIFVEETLSRAAALPTIRSYMRLYTSIDTGKLASFLGLPQQTVVELMMALKIKSWQRQGVAGVSETNASKALDGQPSEQPATHASDIGTVRSFSGSERFPFTVTDLIHFFVSEDMIQVEESKPKADAAQFFARSVVEFSAMRQSILQAMKREREQKERKAQPSGPRLTTVKVPSSSSRRAGGAFNNAPSGGSYATRLRKDGEQH